MSYHVYRDAAIRVLPAVEPVPLDMPPAEDYDLRETQVCPQCGSGDARKLMVESFDAVRCPECSCEFAPRLEAVSKKVIRRISERARRRNQEMAEALPDRPPAGVDPTDYDLFKKVVDELEGVAPVGDPSGQPELQNA